jgi:hypothetical protein
MSRWLRVGFWFALVSVTSCARSALPIAPGASDEVAGAPAVRPPQPNDAEEACPPCMEQLSAEQSLHCLCRTSKCPRDLKAAQSNVEAYVAYGRGCDQEWFIQRSPHGYDVFVYARGSGSLVFAQHTAGNEAVTCEDGSQQLIVEGGNLAACEHVDFCRFAHVDFAIGIGELDRVKTCNERMFR